MREHEEICNEAAIHEPWGACSRRFKASAAQLLNEGLEVSAGQNIRYLITDAGNLRLTACGRSIGRRRNTVILTSI
jgi:hypothetical protein